jgi:alanine-glyoxylate transaminase/serine-glyoxylate transaminase/serine-pyruvate transaminase
VPDIDPLDPGPRLLLGPGPSDVHPRVLRAMATTLVSHLDPYFLEIMGQTQELLRGVFRTRNQLTLPMSATGMGGMETCLVNLLEPGDRLVVCCAGFFGKRLIEVGERTGAAVTPLNKPWGQFFSLDEVRDVLQRVRPKALAIVHAETSTGVCQPLEGLGALCREFDALLIVDAVTSLGCIPLELDAWQIDAVYSCTQKGLSCPPGMSPVSFGPRALEAMDRRKTKVQSWYLDLSIVRKYWGSERIYHHTAPITMVYALREGLSLVHEEGLETRWERHQYCHQALKAGLLALGLTYVAPEGHQLPQLNAVRIPPGVDDQAVRTKLLKEFGIEVGSGLGEFKGSVWRIGLMGYNSRPGVVLQFLAALERCLLAVGAKVTAGAGVAAAEKALTSA